MNPSVNRTALVEAYRRVREKLMNAFPELADAPDVLADTLEGEVEAPTVIAGFIRDAREDEASVKALDMMVSDLHTRKERLAYRATRRREAALSIMDACGIRKLEQPDFTASIRSVPARVEVTDELALPDDLCRFTRTPDKTAIKNALAKGPVAGAHMTNGGVTLGINTK